MSKTTYTVTKDGWLDGRFRKAGSELTLSERQAKYLRMNGQIVPAGSPPAKRKRAAPTTATAQSSSPEIPDNWRDLDWPDLRSLAASVSEKPIISRDDAVAAIEARLAAGA